LESLRRLFLKSNGSIDIDWQFVVFLVLLQSYPDDDDGKSDRNMLLINNV